MKNKRSDAEAGKREAGKRPGFIARVFLFMAAAALSAAPARAVGLRTKFGEVLIRNLKIGQTYSLFKLLNMPLRVVNSGERAEELKIDVIPVPDSTLKEGYVPIPDISWVKVEQGRFTVEPGKEAVTDIIISIPNDPKLLGRRFQADIWSRTNPRVGMFAVGLQSHLLIHVDPVPPTEEELKKKLVERRVANLDFTLHPTEGLAEGVPLGRDFDLKKERKLSIKLVNPNDETLHFKLRSIGGWESLLQRAEGFEDPLDPKWARPAQDLLELPGNSVREVSLIINIPDEARFRGKSYFFVVSAEVLEQEIPARAYYKLYVGTENKAVEGGTDGKKPAQEKADEPPKK